MRRMKLEHLLCFTDYTGVNGETKKHFTNFAYTFTIYPLNAWQTLLREGIKLYDNIYLQRT